MFWLIQISLDFVPEGPIVRKSASIPVMAWATIMSNWKTTQCAIKTEFILNHEQQLNIKQPDFFGKTNNVIQEAYIYNKNMK